jgi:hypothetical protein
MRLSIDPDDPGFDPRAVGCATAEIRITLDGLEQSGVITADEEAGLIVALLRDKDGRLIHDWTKGEPARVERRGVVAIELPAGWGAGPGRNARCRSSWRS